MTSPDMEFRTAFREYIQSTGDWSDEALALDWHKETAAKEVSSYLFSLLIPTMFADHTQFIQKRTVDLLGLWGEQERIMDGIEGSQQQGAANAAPPNGVNGLVQMALIILSVVLNSAATKRVFSQFGIIHSKYHNRIHPDKVRKITLVKADIAREFGIPKQSKRKFASLEDFEQNDNDKANPSPPSTSTPLAPVHATPAAASMADDDDTAALAIPHQHLFVATAGELMQEAGDKDKEAGNEPQTSPATTSSQSQAPAPPLTSNDDPMSLAALFHYPDQSAISATTWKSLAEFWRYGEAGLHNEEVFHEFVHANPSESSTPGA